MIFGLDPPNFADVSMTEMASFGYRSTFFAVARTKLRVEIEPT